MFRQTVPDTSSGDRKSSVADGRLRSMKFDMNMFLDKHTNPVAFLDQRSSGVGFWVFFCLHDAAATRGEYLALSKA